MNFVTLFFAIIALDASGTPVFQLVDAVPSSLEVCTAKAIEVNTVTLSNPPKVGGVIVACAPEPGSTSETAPDGDATAP